MSELVPQSRSKVGGLLADDVVFFADILKIRIRRSKTDVYGRGVWLTIRPTLSSACPVSLVKSFLDIRVGGAVFLSHADGSPLSQFQFLSIFKKALLLCGREPRDFGSHSFRIGAATVADALGLPTEQIKSMGRWKSDCYLRYIRPHLLA